MVNLYHLVLHNVLSTYLVILSCMLDIDHLISRALRTVLQNSSVCCIEKEKCELIRATTFTYTKKEINKIVTSISPGIYLYLLLGKCVL